MTTDELVTLYLPSDSVPPLPALSGLDSMDWSAVRDAYGPAHKIPALLRALASCEPIHRNYAMQALFQYIWHQGTVYSATSTAVPILFELLESNGPQDKSAIAFLLASIAVGKPPFSRCENDPQEAAKWSQILSNCNRSLNAEMVEGRQYGAEIRKRIVTRLDLLYPYLRDHNPEVRHSVAVAVGQFPEIVNRLLPDLEEALENEPDEFVRSALREITNRRTVS